jgi:hypothetical protein
MLVVAGHADDRLIAQERRGGDVAIVLAQVHAIGTDSRPGLDRRSR